jgi:hypothetical protein
MPVTGSERKLSATIAAHDSWAQTTDRSARTAPARAAMDAKFLAEADGDPIRAAHLRKAHFARLALTSARSRRKSRELTESAEVAETELNALGEGPEPPGRGEHPSARRDHESRDSNSATPEILLRDAMRLLDALGDAS